MKAILLVAVCSAVLLLFSQNSAAMSCASSTIVAPPAVVEDTAGALHLAEAVNCSGGSFEVEWFGSVTVEETIRVLDGTVLVISGAADGSASVNGEHSTSLFEVNGGTLSLSDLTLANGTGAEFAGAIDAIDSVVSVTNCAFFGNAGGQGGGVYLLRSGLEATNVSFAGNKASDSGGAIAILSSDVTVTGDALFRGNSAQFGGAVSCKSSSLRVTCESASFANNHAAAVGGAVVAQNSSIVLSGMMAFDDKIADIARGFVHVESRGMLVGSGLEATNVSFVGNTANESGGAIVALSSDITVTVATSFEENNAQVGGAVALANNSTLVLADNQVSFSRNIATSDGGAVIAVNSSILVSGVATFESNTAEYGGGACLSRTSFVVNDIVYFANNVASHSGGGLYGTDSAHVDVTGNAVWESNVANLTGGGLELCSHSKMQVSGSVTFVNNTGDDGAGVYLSSNSTLFSSGSSTFDSNKAMNGGGGFVTSSADVFFTGMTSFVNNSADPGDGRGGGIVLLGTANVWLSGGGVFTNNSAAKGGAIGMAKGSSVVISNFVGYHTDFSGNTASQEGGGVYCELPAVFYIMNTRFSSNHAGVNGGAFSITSAGSMHDRAKFQDCSFSGNTAGYNGGAIDSVSGFVNVIRSEFDKNIAGRSGGAIRSTGLLTIRNCTFTGNQAGTGSAISNVGKILGMQEVAFANNTLRCDDGTFLDWKCTSAFEVECEGCIQLDQWSDCTVQNPDNAQVCQLVLEHTTSFAPDGTLESLSLDPGYWRSSATSRDIRECYEADACVGGMQGHYCAAGYDGPLCAVCAEGYALASEYVCSKCSRERTLHEAVSATILAVVTLSAVVLTVRYLWSHEAPAARNTSRYLTNVRKFFVKRAQKLKIVVVCWQIVSQFSSAAMATYPKEYQIVLEFINVFNFNLDVVLSPGCLLHVDFYDYLLLATLGPIMVAVMVLTLYAVKTTMRGAVDTGRLVLTHGKILLWVSLVVYSAASTFVFQTFACDVLDSGVSFLRADHSLECYTPNHTFYIVYASIMVLVYPVGIPVCYFCVLRARRAELVDEERESSSDNHVGAIKGLWESYRPEMYWYEVVECLRRVSLSVVVAFVRPDTAGCIVWVFILAFVFTVLMVVSRPYADDSDFTLALIGHVVVLLSMFVALMRKVDVTGDESSSQAVFGYALVVLNIVMVLLIGGEGLMHFTQALNPEVGPVSRRPLLEDAGVVGGSDLDGLEMTPEGSGNLADRVAASATPPPSGEASPVPQTLQQGSPAVRRRSSRNPTNAPPPAGFVQ